MRSMASVVVPPRCGVKNYMTGFSQWPRRRIMGIDIQRGGGNLARQNRFRPDPLH